jgi:hypothetical protein
VTDIRKVTRAGLVVCVFPLSLVYFSVTDQNLSLASLTTPFFHLLSTTTSFRLRSCVLLLLILLLPQVSTLFHFDSTYWLPLR